MRKIIILQALVIIFLVGNIFFQLDWWVETQRCFIRYEFEDGFKGTAVFKECPESIKKFKEII